MDSEWHASALTPRSLTWDRSAFTKAPTRRPRRRFENEAVAWQLASQRGGWGCIFLEGVTFSGFPVMR